MDEKDFEIEQIKRKIKDTKKQIRAAINTKNSTSEECNKTNLKHLQINLNMLKPNILEFNDNQEQFITLAKYFGWTLEEIDKLSQYDKNVLLDHINKEQQKEFEIHKQMEEKKSSDRATGQFEPSKFGMKICDKDGNEKLTCDNEGIRLSGENGVKTELKLDNYSKMTPCGLKHNESNKNKNFYYGGKYICRYVYTKDDLRKLAEELFNIYDEMTELGF